MEYNAEQLNKALDLIGLGGRQVLAREERVAKIMSDYGMSPFAPPSLTEQELRDCAEKADDIMVRYMDDLSAAMLANLPAGEGNKADIIRMCIFAGFLREAHILTEALGQGLQQACAYVLAAHHHENGTLQEAISGALSRIIGRDAPEGYVQTAEEVREQADLDAKFEAGELEPLLYGKEALEALGDCACDNCSDMRNLARAGAPVHVVDEATFWIGPPDANRAVGLN